MNIQENERTVQEIWALFRETRESIEETGRKIRAMSEEFERNRKEDREEFREIRERFKETDRQFKSTDKKIDKVAGMFDTQWGKLMESLVEGGVLSLFQQRGIHVREIYRRAESRLDGRNMEIDLLLVNDSDVIVIEVKTTLKADHVRDFLEKMKDFPLFFRRYAKLNIYGALAALRTEQESGRFAEKQGLFVIKIGGEGMAEILNSKDFRPATFGQ